MIKLYVKTHNKTGLKYLGKTTRDPKKYHGSGLYWKRHLKKYGNDVTTKVLFETNDKKLFKEKAIYYSQLYNIVNSNNWANIREETGHGGFSKEDQIKGFKNGISKNLQYYGKINGKSLKGKAPWNKGKTLSNTHKEAVSQSLINHNINPATKIKIGESLKQYYKINDSKIKGIVREKIICPHCGKLGARNVMARWHFDNCKRNNASVV